jgi:hypothetical protein
MLKEEPENDQALYTSRLIDFSTQPKYIKIKESFEKLFRKNVLYPNQKFDKEVWFLKTDTEFQNMIKPTSASTPTPTHNLKMLNLLAELSTGGNDMKKLNVQVSKFIERICDILFKAQLMIIRSSEQISEYRAYENVSVLEVKISDINKKIREKSAMSKLNIKISRLDMLPEGNYFFMFNYTEMDPSVIKSTKNVYKQLEKNKTLKITEGGRSLVLSNDPNNDSKFEQIEFHAIEVAENSKSLQDFTYSGTSLSGFKLQIFRDEMLFAESTYENFLEMFLVNINTLKDINSSTFSINWKLSCKLDKDILTNLKVPINNLLEDYDTFLEFKFDFDPISLGSIFYRVMHIFKDVIHTKTENQHVIEDILEYFKPIKDEVKHILEKPEDLPEENKCCNSCSIF